jgi:putative glutamine amidotransferase
MYWLDIASEHMKPVRAGPSVEQGVRQVGPPASVGVRPDAHHPDMRPLIGVTTSEMRESRMSTSRRHGEPAHPEMALGMTYLRTLDRAGAMPVVLPPAEPERVGALLDRLDGVCLSGGPDLDPGAYGAADRHPQLGETEPALDAFELALASAAIARGIPVLGVCRGAQALNVACGGTLHQHVPGPRQAAAATEPTHRVRVLGRTRLAEIMGGPRLTVNSFHHQAVDRLGAGLRVSAEAQDGTIEAIEALDRTGFVLGVQWHAETLADHVPLFAALVGAAQPVALSLAA